MRQQDAYRQTLGCRAVKTMGNTQCWKYKQVNGRAAMASSSEPGKFFRGPLWEGPNFCKFCITPTTDFHNGRVNKSCVRESQLVVAVSFWRYKLTFYTWSLNRIPGKTNSSKDQVNPLRFLYYHASHSHTHTARQREPAADHLQFANAPSICALSIKTDKFKDTKYSVFTSRITPAAVALEKISLKL